eukprot:TRINITY_DN12084_c3_g3_i1.p1 TRINITY_DN12084_c3_g3~~TRINITY_DN12084_c3_g3_i1.p1  ORF type:complete len:1119 (+),score=369.58 TRINITY_DN12084_c3_g3_i1:159-3515(+)
MAEFGRIGMSFHQAAREGNTDEIDAYLERGQESAVSLRSGSSSRSSSVPFIDQPDEQGLTALHYAARNNQAKVVQLLINKGANPMVTDSEQITPVHLAAQFSDSQVLQTLLEVVAPEQLRVQDSYGGSILHYACMRPEPECAGLLMDRCAEQLVDLVDESDQSPLHYAADSDHVEVIQLLLQNGFNPASEDKEKRTPLEVAANQGNLASVKALVEGKDISLFLKHVDARGHSALNFAVYSGDYNTVEWFLRKGWNPNHKDRGSNRTPMHTAARQGDANVVRLLASFHGSLFAKDNNGLTAVHRAAAFGRVEVVQFILGNERHRHALLNKNTYDGFTPLYLACTKGHLDVVQCLFEYPGIDLLDPDKVGRTVLHVACEKGHYDIASALVDAYMAQMADQEEEDVNGIVDDDNDNDADTVSTYSTFVPWGNLTEARDKYDRRPLHAAAEHGHTRIVKMLLDKGRCDVDPNDDAEISPIHLAAREGHLQVAKLLIKARRGVVFSEDEKAQTPLHFAAHYGRLHVLNLLIANKANVNGKDDSMQTPLMEAAMTGRYQCAQELLNNDASLHDVDKDGRTALHLAARAGHARLVELFLSTGRIDKQDRKGFTPLDWAVLNNHVEVARVIVRHPTWRTALRPSITPAQAEAQGDSSQVGFTPLKRLIVAMPDVALQVLNKLMTVEGTADAIDYRVDYDFNPLIDAKAAGSASVYDPIYYMMLHKQGDLLLHPVVNALLALKWNKFGGIVFYINFVIYCLFVFFVTAFVLENDINQPEPWDETSVLSRVSAIGALLIALLNLMVECAQLYSLRLDYFTGSNFLDLGAYLSTIIMVGYAFTNSDDGSVVADRWDHAWYAGAIAVFLAWMNLLIYVRRFGSVGIYVLMMTYTLATASKVLAVFGIFIVAFGLSFYIMLQAQQDFRNPGASLIKSLVMMTGEYEFDGIFLGGECADDFDTEAAAATNCLPFDDLMYPMMVVFVILMNIVLMNLLIGLAVGDIEQINDHAATNRQLIKAKYIRTAESVLPVWIRTVPRSLSILPNDDHDGSLIQKIMNNMLAEDANATPAVDDPEGSATEVLRHRTKLIRDHTSDVSLGIQDLSRRVRDHTQVLKKLAARLDENIHAGNA